MDTDVLVVGAGPTGLMLADAANAAALARTRIPQPSFYLVRPDGHLGLCGGRLEATAVKAYVSERLRIGIYAEGAHVRPFSASRLLREGRTAVRPFGSGIGLIVTSLFRIFRPRSAPE
jgi:hypothetical protein